MSTVDSKPCIFPKKKRKKKKHHVFVLLTLITGPTRLSSAVRNPLYSRKTSNGTTPKVGRPFFGKTYDKSGGRRKQWLHQRVVGWLPLESTHAPIIEFTTLDNKRINITLEQKWWKNWILTITRGDKSLRAHWSLVDLKEETGSLPIVTYTSRIKWRLLPLIDGSILPSSFKTGFLRTAVYERLKSKPSIRPIC